MALIVCHSPKGGVGTTFLAAHLAMGLTEVDGSDGVAGDINLLTLSSRDLAPLHFGLVPGMRLPTLAESVENEVLAGGISLRCEPGAATDPDFLARLDDAGYLSDDAERTLVIDVPAGERALARRLMPLASVHVCPLMASPDCLALLPQVLEEAEGWGARRIKFVIGKLDETRKLERHVAAFAREVLGERLIAKIRNDQSVPEALAMLQRLSRYAPASVALADARLAAQAIIAILEADRRSDEQTDDAPRDLRSATRSGASRAA